MAHRHKHKKNGGEGDNAEEQGLTNDGQYVTDCRKPRIGAKEFENTKHYEEYVGCC